MQNIKCIPADRKLLSSWTEEASGLLRTASSALSAAEEGEAPDSSLPRKVSQLASTTASTAERIQTEKLRETMTSVGSNLKQIGSTLSETEGARAAISPLRELVSLLREHT